MSPRHLRLRELLVSSCYQMFPWPKSLAAILTMRRKYQLCVEVSENKSSSISSPADSSIKFDPTGNSLLLAWGACPMSKLSLIWTPNAGDERFHRVGKCSCFPEQQPSPPSPSIHAPQQPCSKGWYKPGSCYWPKVISKYPNFHFPKVISKIIWKISEHIPLTFGTTLQ